MQVTVTGGSGFIGSHVVDLLIEHGHQVTVIDGQKPHRQEVTWCPVDLLDLAAVIEATKQSEQIFHLAAVADVNQAFADPMATVQLNVTGTAHVLQAARHNACQRVHLASTVWVYGAAPAGEETLTEQSLFALDQVDHIYVATKLAAEMLCHSYQQLYDLPITILRYGIPYGPRMRDALLIPIFLRKALQGQALTVAGKGEQFRNFIYVRDLAKAHVLAMADHAANQTYNLEGQEAVTVLQVAEGIRHLLGDQVKIDFVPARPGDYQGRTISADKAHHQLGWQPEIMFAQGLAQTVQWFQQHWR